MSLRSLERVVGVSGKNRATNNYAKLVVANLLKKGVIQKLAKGCYTNRNDAGLAVLCFQPAYLGLQSALSFHGLWEQETIPVIITATKARQGRRSVLGMNVVLHRIQHTLVFGVTYELDGEQYLPCSDIEKTFLDLLYFKQNISGEVLMQFRKKVDRKKLMRYVLRYPETVRKQVRVLLNLLFPKQL